MKGSTSDRIKSPAGRTVMAMVGLACYSAGWVILLHGSFETTRKYSKEITTVDGWSAVFIAGLFLLMAAMTALIVFKSMGARRTTLIQLGLLLFVPAVVLVAFRP
jgi:TRAP-type C4-dicarboxylate transport system permease small subunit